MNKFGDHPGLPLLFGVCTERTPYCLVMQFHENQDDTSYTISTVLWKKRTADKDDVGDKDHCQNSGNLSLYSRKRLLHDDLRSNNVVLDNRDGVYRL